MSDLEAPVADLRLDEEPRTLLRIQALPAELRQHILRHLLHSSYARLDVPLRRTFTTPKDEFLALDMHTKSFIWDVAVLRTCKILCRDGEDILYNEN